MHDSTPGQPRPRAGEEELSAFGFDDSGDRWLDCLRRASRRPALGHIGPYEVLAEIGRGGQGVVYRARQPGTGRDVALKRLISGSFASQEARQRFDGEIRAAATLEHPHIVTVFSRDIIDGQPILAMQWIEGLPITDWAAHSGGSPADGESDGCASRPRGPREMVIAFLKVVQAVHYAHQRGLIHRDLKPSNILVDARGDPHVLDFGLAKAIDSSSLDAQESVVAEGAVGTPAYAAPEQLEAGPQRVDIRADVYALGAVLYRMLTGRLPYTASRSAAEALAAIRAGLPALPSTWSAGADRELDAIVLQALSPEPAERYQSMDAFAADLGRYLAGEPVAACSRSRLYVLRKFVARHRVPVGLAGVMAASLLTFAVVAALLARRAEQARREERAARLVAEEVNAFLGDILSAARPSRGGANVTLLEMLDQASDRARSELSDQPRVAAEVLYHIGFTYRTLWRYDQALPHLEQALTIERQLHDGDHENLARCLSALGSVQTSRRQPVAVDLQSQALAMRRRLYGVEHELIAESLMRLGYSLHQAAAPPRWAEAEAHIGEALAMYRRVLGPDHRDVGSCLHNYGWLRVRQSRIAEAAELYAEALEIFRRLGNLHDPFYAECMYGYVAQLLKLQRYEEASAWLDEAIPLIRRIYGENDSLRSLLWQRAEALQALGRFEDSRGAFAEAFEALLTRQADDHPQLASALRRWKISLAATAEGQRLELPAWELAAVLPELPAQEHTRLAAGLHRYARLLADEGQKEQAVALIEHLREQRAAAGAPGDAALAWSLELLADEASGAGRWEEAEALYEQALQLLVSALPWVGWEQARVHSALGACLASQGRFDEAEALLTESREVLARSLGPSHPFTRAAEAHLAQLCEK